MELKNKKIAVLGLGKSGVSSALKLAKIGAIVTAFDNAAEDKFDPAVLSRLKEAGAQLKFGEHAVDEGLKKDIFVVSPGVHLDIPILLEAKKKNIPIISEIELASYFISKPIIAITGTNGKTTTTTLVGEMLKAGGLKAAVAGNIGYPLVDVDDSSLDFVVAEISSYQLEGILSFRPWISVVLNIQPDHLERHHTMEEYIEQKKKIFMNQTGDDYLIYNEDDPLVVKMVKSAMAKKVGFAKTNASLIITLDPGKIHIPGKHNLENALAAAQAAKICGVKDAVISNVLMNFPGVEHRIEFTAKINGIDFYNDSKGTNPDSTIVAIDTFFGRGIVLILGGRDKGVDLTLLAEKVKANVHDVVLIGEAANRFEDALIKAGFTNCTRAASLSTAVHSAFSKAKEGNVVLFSPACASFDMFKNYEERGRVFKAEVKRLEK